VLLVDGDVRFLPAASVVRVVVMPLVTPVPGGPPALLGIALHEGTILPVLAVGAARREMLVCQWAGELIGVVGVEVVRTGFFAAASGQPDAVDYEGRLARQLDLGVLYDGVQGARRAGPFAIVS
jgi:hypothetical protein